MGGQRAGVGVEARGDTYSVTRVGGEPMAVRLLPGSGARRRVEIDGVQRWISAVFDQDTLHLDDGAFCGRIGEAPPKHVRQAEAGGDGRLLAPMSGRIVAVHAVAGASVAKGQPIVILESMKIEHEIKAPGGGTLSELLVKPG